MSTSRLLLCAPWVFCIGVPAIQAQVRRLDVVALTGQRAPGTTLTFGDFTQPVINNRGHVLFRGFMNNAPIVASTGLWLHNGAQNNLMVRAGLQAPGAPSGAIFVNFVGFSGSYYLNESDQFTMNPPLINSGYTGTEPGVWLSSPGGTIVPAVVPKRQAPGFPIGVTIDRVQLYEFSNSGQAVISVDLANSTITDAIYSGLPGALEVVVRTNDPAPGFPFDVRFSAIDVNPKIDQAGNLLFTTVLQGTNINSGNDDVIWRRQDGELSILARQGDPIPSLSDSTWGQFGRNRLSGERRVLFIADILGPTPAETGPSLWAGDMGDPRLIARRAQPAPGLPDYTFTNFDDLMLEDNGNFVFRAGLAGEDGPPAIYSGDANGNLYPVALTTDQAPDMPPATTYLSLGQATTNAAGVVAFDARLNGPGINASNDRAFFAGLPGDVHLIVREGDLVEISPGVTRTVRSIREIPEFPTGYSEHLLNDAGQFLMVLSFIDGSSGIFLATVPEPSIAGACAAFLTLTIRPRRRAVPGKFAQCHPPFPQPAPLSYNSSTPNAHQAP